MTVAVPDDLPDHIREPLVKAAADFATYWQGN